MTYQTEDQAIESAEPVELYHFEGPTGFEYFYTSSRESQSYDGDTYTPLAISRGEVIISDIMDPAELVITVPLNSQVVQDYFPIPIRALDVTIYRRHGFSAFVNTEWKGAVVEMAPKGIEVEMRTASRSSLALSQPFPRLRIQEMCQHDFGDSRCGIDVAGSHTLATTVSSISSDGLEITVASVGSGTLKGGEIRRTSDGESRMIRSVSGTTLTLDFPFYEIAATDAVSLVSGCDRKATTCDTVYNNIANHGGHPFMPRQHPFLIKV